MVTNIYAKICKLYFLYLLVQTRKEIPNENILLEILIIIEKST